MTKIRTKTDPAALARAAENQPMQLREWGTDRVFPLPAPKSKESIIGSGAHCWLRLQDEEHFISRKHAALRTVGAYWCIADLGSKNGLWVDGRRTDTAVLEPGIEIGIGRRRLLVESPRTVRRTSLLARFLGWGREQQHRVDRGLRALREYEVGRAPLWLAGADDLIDLGRHLHREVVGRDLPFAVANLDRGTSEAKESLRTLDGGTLCIWARRPAIEMPALRSLFEGRNASRMIICTRAVEQVSSIDIPSLSAREDEIERIVVEYAIDALLELGAKSTSFPTVDRERLVNNPPETLAEIELATRRLIAIREFGGVTHAAPHLGVTHSALSRWLARFMARRSRRTQVAS